jgi:alkanesulfonate monooxygenase SsuD/methylene tetrahydromethanopterin reductase-like flavin-dependent oxidoreductase (luciferase family)
MSNIQFGFCLPIFAQPGAQLFRTPGFAHVDPQAALRMGRLADALGYDSLWVADHLMLGKDLAILEGWTTLATLAGMTQHARLGIIHYNNALRHPALTAKMAATLDQLSNGRLIHFVDFGNRPYEYLAYGLHADDTRPERIAQMCEGLDLTLVLWTSNTPVTFDGTYYHTHEAVCQPQPLQQPRPPIWIGEAYPEILDATVKYADVWNNTPVSLSEFKQRLDALSAACQRIGRNPNEIGKSLEIQLLIAPDHAALRRKLQTLLALAPQDDAAEAALHDYLTGQTDQLPPFMADTWIAGTPAEATVRVQAYVDAGISHFMFWCADAPDEGSLRLFAEQIMPRFR